MSWLIGESSVTVPLAAAVAERRGQGRLAGEVRPRLEHQDPATWILGQPRGEDAAGRTGSDDQVVDGRPRMPPLPGYSTLAGAVRGVLDECDRRT